jgi:hypothetical protein
MSAWVSGILSSSAKLISISLETMPSIRSVQVSGATWGSTRSVSTR